jgi:hypothetical protein
MTIPRSSEVSWWAATSAFEDDEPEITEHVADAIALGLEALLAAIAVVIVLFVVGAIF